MSITAGEVARSALADLNEPQTGLLNALRWVGERYSQLAGRRLKQLRRIAAVNIPAVITAGSCVVTNGSDIVDGDGDAEVAWTATPPIGRYFRTQANWYEIVAWDLNNAQLRLATPFTETTTIGGAYQIVQRYVSLPADVQFLGTFMHTRLYRELEKWSLTELDLMAPERLYVSSGPSIVAEFGEDPDGNKRVEFYPYSTNLEQVAFTYWARPPEHMDDATTLPGAITVGELKEGVLVNLKQHKMSQAAAAGNVELAAFWRNEYRAQEAVWMKAIIPAIVKRDQGVEDKVVLLRSVHGSGRRTIENAHDEIWARGNRP